LPAEPGNSAFTGTLIAGGTLDALSAELADRGWLLSGESGIHGRFEARRRPVL